MQDSRVVSCTAQNIYLLFNSCENDSGFIISQLKHHSAYAGVHATLATYMYSAYRYCINTR
jgi:hypothetical protein